MFQVWYGLDNQVPMTPNTTLFWKWPKTCKQQGFFPLDFPSPREQESVPDPKTLQIQRDKMGKGWGKGTAGTDEHAIRCLQISFSLCDVCRCVISVLPVDSGCKGDSYLKKQEESKEVAVKSQTAERREY